MMTTKLEEYLNYLKVNGKSLNTREAYERDLQQFFAYILDKYGHALSLAEVDRHIIRDFMGYLYESLGNSNRSISRKLTSLKGFFKYAVSKHWIPNNPALIIKNPKFEKKIPQFFSEKDMDLLLSLPDLSSKFGVRNLAILELFYSSGLRISELTILTTESIDFNKKIIRVHGKGDKTRLIPVGSKAIEAIQNYLAIRDSFKSKYSKNILFLSKSGRLLDRHELSEILTQYINVVAQRRGYSAHTLRHTFATHMMSNGSDILAIQEMLGHASLSSTEIYTHVTMTDLTKAVNLLHPRSKPKKDKE